MDHDDRAFLDYRARPGRDTLVALLRTQQSNIYNVCFQVLRHAQDAEDAAQEVLVEVIRGAGALREPRAFRSWLYRVALHTALDHVRRRAARSGAEKERAAMTADGLDSPALPIHEALAKLDDDDRCLLIEKYFEHSTLERLAARDGVSTTAVWKRIERARERLKNLLMGAGLVAAASRVEAQLEALRPVSSTTDFVGTSTSVQAAIAGGAAMGAKSVGSLTTGAVVLALLLLGGSALIVARRGGSRPPAAGPRDETRSNAPALEGSAVPDGPVQASHPPPSAQGPAAAPAPAILPRPEEIVERLERLKGWLQKERPALKTAADFDRWFQEAKVEADGLRDLILAHPRAFLDWLSRPDNSPIASNLVAVTLSGKKTQWDTPSQEFASLPRELTDGLLEWTHGSDVYLNVAVLQLALTLKDAPASYRERYLAQVSSDDPLIRELAAKALLTTGDLSTAEAGGIAAYLDRVEDFRARSHLVQSIGRVPSEPIRDWLLTTLESGRFDDPAGRLTYAGLEYWLEHSPGPAFDDRAGRILGSALRRVDDPQGYFYLVLGAVSLPLKEARALLTQAASGAPSEQLRRAATAMLARPDSELKDMTARRGAWLDAFWKK